MFPRTFRIATLGCKVNQYEAEQISALLRDLGLTAAAEGQPADLNVIHTCSITSEAAAKSRQIVRRAVRAQAKPGRTIVTGCWASSDAGDAAAIAGVDAVLGHDQPLATRLKQLLSAWQNKDHHVSYPATTMAEHTSEPLPESVGYDGWMINKAGTPTSVLCACSKALSVPPVKENSGKIADEAVRKGERQDEARAGTIDLPQLAGRQDRHQRAMLKIQDGCDARCTYCIVPSIRRRLWSRPVDAVIDEARRMVDAGHQEIVLTGIFLGAYGQRTALRRRQTLRQGPGALAELAEALCAGVQGLRRLRFSSLEPGDLTEAMVGRLADLPQVMPHFHIPIQSGSDAVLRRMNRQYQRADVLRAADRLQAAFDRPALTCDAIVGFPGETDADFAGTLEVIAAGRFSHVHAFPFSARPGTPTARWVKDIVPSEVVHRRMDSLAELSAKQGMEYRRQFVGQTVEVLVERPGKRRQSNIHCGRCERYFMVSFESLRASVGEAVRLRINRVDLTGTWGDVP